MAGVDHLPRQSAISGRQQATFFDDRVIKRQPTRVPGDGGGAALTYRLINTGVAAIEKDQMHLHAGGGELRTARLA